MYKKNTINLCTPKLDGHIFTKFQHLTIEKLIREKLKLYKKWQNLLNEESHKKTKTLETTNPFFSKKKNYQKKKLYNKHSDLK